MSNPRLDMWLTQEDIDRFWSKVKVLGPDDCWVWMKAKSKLGYGVFSIRHTWCSAHRVSFYIANGYLPDFKNNKKIVMHDCENPACQNPKHLIEGTIKENGNYPGCVAKHKLRCGPNHHMYGITGPNNPHWGMKRSEETKAKISNFAKKRGGWHKGLKRSAAVRAQIKEMTRRTSRQHSPLSEKDVSDIRLSTERNKILAARYKVHSSTISRIQSGQRWNPN